jgi:hypothetical protein
LRSPYTPGLFTPGPDQSDASTSRALCPGPRHLVALALADATATRWSELRAWVGRAAAPIGEFAAIDGGGSMGIQINSVKVVSRSRSKRDLRPAGTLVGALAVRGQRKDPGSGAHDLGLQGIPP